MERIFLDAEWRKLVMANYLVSPEVLAPYLPKHVELDLWEGRCYLSLVGFMFKNTKILGLKIPFHTNFEEVNLRFYVRRRDENGAWRRGVVFIQEIVPKLAITLVANMVYHENYESCPMSHNWRNESYGLEVAYSWNNGRENRIEVQAENDAIAIEEGSEAEFITEHYWGYSKYSDVLTNEYQVEHPRWKAYRVKDYLVDVDFKRQYGSDFAYLNNDQPFSVFLVEGSEVLVRAGVKIK